MWSRHWPAPIDGAGVLFFFYGTLIAGNAHPLARAVHARLAPAGAAMARGRLWAIADPAGWYPAMAPGDGAVRGQLYAALPAFADADLAALDAFEDYRADDAAGSLYLRRAIRVVRADGAVAEAQAYLFNAAVPDHAPLIADGDFAGWLAARAASPFGGDAP